MLDARSNSTHALLTHSCQGSQALLTHPCVRQVVEGAPELPSCPNGESYAPQHLNLQTQTFASCAGLVVEGPPGQVLLPAGHDEGSREAVQELPQAPGRGTSLPSVV